MMQQYDIHPDFKMLTNIRPPLNRVTLPLLQGLLKLLFLREKSDRNVRVERISVPTGDGHPLRALLYTPMHTPKTERSLLYCHGGGYVFPAAPYQYTLARLYARELGCRVLMVDYRVAPQDPFPAAPEDCFAAYRYLLNSGGGSIAVCGDSAGGCLAAAVSLYAQKEGLPMPCGQLLTYPAAGDCGETESIRLYTDTPMCNTRDMNSYGRMYVPDPDAGELMYRSPIQADSLAGMPMTYVETAEFDCLRDGGILFAQRLTREGVPTELHNTKGTVHGYDMALKSGIVQQCIRDRLAFLRRCFGMDAE